MPNRALSYSTEDPDPIWIHSKVNNFYFGPNFTYGKIFKQTCQLPFD